MKSILSLTETINLSFIADTSLQSGYQYLNSHNLRAALKTIKQHRPVIIIAEFIYRPTYGTQLSNFESLLASIQRDITKCRLIALFNKEDLHHLQKVTADFNLFDKLSTPASNSQIIASIKAAMVQLT